MNEISAIANLLSIGFSFFAANRDDLMAILESLDKLGCHDAIDVAQDALDAYQAGHLSKEQALGIVKICLERKQKPVQQQQQDFWADKLNRGIVNQQEFDLVRLLDQYR